MALILYNYIKYNVILVLYYLYYISYIYMHRQLFLLYYETHWRSGPPDTYIQSHNFLTVPLSGSTINGLAEVLYVNCNQKFKYIDFLKKQKKKWTCWTWNFIFWSTMSNCLLQKLHSIYSQKQWWKVPIFCIFPTARMVNHFFIFVILYMNTISTSWASLLDDVKLI